MTVMTDVLMAVLASFVLTIAIFFIAYLAWKSSERVESEPRYRRVVSLGLGAIYLFGGLNGIYSAATGKSTAWSLVVLLISVFSAWKYLRSASRIKVPTK